MNSAFLEKIQLLDKGVCTDKGKGTLKMIKQDLNIGDNQSIVDYLSEN